MSTHHLAPATAPCHAESTGHDHHRTGHENRQVDRDRLGQRNHHGQSEDKPWTPSLDRTALMATLHCLSGCTIGEVLGLAIGTALGWSSWPTIGLAIGLALFFGYAMTLYPLRRAGLAWGTALGLAFASDTLSMTTMELVDNAIMVIIPGAMDAGVVDPLFWGSLLLSLLVAGVAAFPVNRWLIFRGKGHALVHGHHCH